MAKIIINKHTNKENIGRELFVNDIEKANGELIIVNNKNNPSLNILNEDEQVIKFIDENAINKLYSKVNENINKEIVNRTNALEETNNNINEISTTLSKTNEVLNFIINEDKEKTIRKIANEELAAQLLSGNAEADFKTLQELSQWLENHPEDVSEINFKINETENKLQNEINRAINKESELLSSVNNHEKIVATTDIYGHIKLGVTEETAAKGNHTHDDLYYTETEVNSLLNTKSNTGHTHTKSEITDFEHTHDDLYYTETEVNNLLSGKSDTGHTHDDIEQVISTSMVNLNNRITDLESQIEGKSEMDHTHDDIEQVISTSMVNLDNRITDLESQIEGKSEIGHTHDDSRLTNLENQVLRLQEIVTQLLNTTES